MGIPADSEKKKEKKKNIVERFFLQNLVLIDRKFSLWIRGSFVLCTTYNHRNIMATFSLTKRWILCSTTVPIVSYLQLRKQQESSCRPLLRTQCDAVPVSSSQDTRTSVIASSSSSFGSHATYPANNPTEDRAVMYEDGGYRMATVFDGHGGWKVSEFASKTLVPLVLKKLSKLRTNQLLDDVMVDDVILSSFQEIENAYISSIEQAYQEGTGSVANVGSCVGMVLKKGNRLTVANAGDCRTVLGSEINVGGGNKYVATRLSRDHNARVPLEVTILKQQHPGEEDQVVRCHKHNPSACYVKGRLQLSRSLGDLYLKHHRFNAKEGQPRSMGRHIPHPYTPPYVSAIPDMTHVRLDPEHDRFVIVASDGVWDFLSDEEAVAIVGECIRQQPNIAQTATTKQQSIGKVAAEVLVEATLRRAAQECGMTYEALLSLPPGKQRRSRHDDTTAVIMFF